ncbi:MAG: RNA polymerase subunit sigma [Planctomycetaceae bacterium]|nr:RNA polymerase subunit sigma [Planctomycetaceae bacterium]
MSGPIVRTGTTPKFWKNWDRIFGDASSDQSTAGKSAKGKTAKSKTAAKASGSKTKKAAKKAKKTGK